MAVCTAPEQIVCEWFIYVSFRGLGLYWLACFIQTLGSASLDNLKQENRAISDFDLFSSHLFSVYFHMLYNLIQQWWKVHIYTTSVLKYNCEVLYFHDCTSILFYFILYKRYDELTKYIALNHAMTHFRWTFLLSSPINHLTPRFILWPFGGSNP